MDIKAEDVLSFLGGFIPGAFIAVFTFGAKAKGLSTDLKNCNEELAKLRKLIVDEQSGELRLITQAELHRQQSACKDLTALQLKQHDKQLSRIDENIDDMRAMLLEIVPKIVRRTDTARGRKGDEAT